MGIFREDVEGEYHQNQRISSGAVNPLEQGVEPGAEYGMFNIYQNMVKSYNQRELSYPLDALKAFSGIISALQKRFKWTFLSALPEELIHLGLLRRPMANSSRRFSNISNTTALPSDIRPSWCWTAWTGNMYWDPWRTDSYAGNGIQIKSEIQSFAIRDAVTLRPIKAAEASSGSSPSSAFSDELRKLNEALRHKSDLSQRLTLCFWAYIVHLTSSSFSLSKPYSKDNNRRRARVSYNQWWINDSTSHHCGTLTGITSWPPSSYDITKYDVVLLSRSYQKVVTEASIKASLDHLPLEYPSSYEYYDEMFDPDHYPLTEDWSMNIMLVEWKGECAERVAIGQIHVNAWKKLGSERKLVLLV